MLVLGGDVAPAFGQQEKLVDGISLVIGGSAAITAVAAARLGLRVALVAAVGADPAGAFMLDQLAAEGVDVRFVVVREDAPTGMTVALSRGGDRAILTALGAMASLTAADVPASLLARARHVHASSWFLLQDSPRAGAGGVVFRRPFGRCQHVTGHQLGSVRTVGRPAPVRRHRAGRPAAAERGGSDRLAGAAGLDAAVGALVAAGPRVVVKLGERGALCADGSARYRVSLPPVTPADTTGAGDCFNAGLIAGLLDGRDLAGAAALGCAAGALSTAAPGGTASAPSLAAATRLASTATIT